MSSTDRTTTGPHTEPPVTADAASRRAVDLRRLPLAILVLAALVPAVALGVLGASLIGRLPVTPPATVGSVAPAFALADLDGNPVRLEDLRGRPVVLNFWASWCGPCVEEFPLLREAADRHAGDDLAIVGIVYQDRSEAARDFMARNGGSWPAVMDPGDRVAAAYGILGPPETFFIGRDGTIVARQIGQFSATSLEEKVAAIIDGE
jgi:cytochrome c biogenesis protein CcmG/thiol:disulfide interchange protein DsbE